MSRHTFTVAGYHLATCILLAFLVFFVTFGREFNPVHIKVHIKTETTGTISIFWPGLTGTYGATRVVSRVYQAGENHLQLILPSFPSRHLLRIDPIAEKGRVHLLGLTIERFGEQLTFQTDDLAKRLAKTSAATVRNSDSGLEIIATSGDPQLFFRDMTLPLPPARTLFALACLFFLLCAALLWTGSRLLKTPPEKFRLHFVIGPIALILIGRTFNWPPAFSLPACALLVLSLQHSTMALYANRPKRPSLQQCWTFAFVVCFLGLLFYPFYLTLSPFAGFLGSIRELSTSLGKTKGPNSLDDLGKKLIKGIEDNLVRNLAFREKLINLNADIKIFGLGFSPTSKVILGKNGMFFEGYGERQVEQDVNAQFDNVTDYMGLIPFDDEELEAWRICLEERYYWLKEKGINYIFALAPSKAAIYQENLPDMILKTKLALNKPTRFEQLSKYLKEHSAVPFVDLSESLLLAKKQGQADNSLASMPLYYRTDFHWTYYGAYVAYRAIITEIQKRYPAYNFVPAPLTDFKIKTRNDWVHAPFIYLLGLNPEKQCNETYLTFLPRPNSLYASIADFGSRGIDDYSIPDHVYRNFGGNLVATRVLKNPHGEARTIFVIGDSFSEKYFGFFSGHAEKTVNFRTVYAFFTKPFEEYSPDLVIQEILEMYLLQKPPTNPPVIRQARVNALGKIAGTN